MSREALITAGQPHARYVEHVNKFGRNPDVDAAVDIWDDDTTYAEQAVDTIPTVSAANAADDGSGTGAQRLLMYGWTAAGERVTDNVALNGGGDANGTVAMAGVDRAYVYQAGTGKTNAGDITIWNNGKTVTHAKILAGNGQTLMAIAYIPANHLAVLKVLSASINSGVPAGTSADLQLMALINGVWRVMDTLALSTSASTPPRFYVPGKVFMEKTLLKVRCTAVQAANTNISASFDYKLYEYGVVA